MARKGDVVYLFTKESLVIRGTDSRTPFWIYVPVFNDGENVFVKINLDGLELDSSETEVEEYEEELRELKIKQKQHEDAKNRLAEKKAQEEAIKRQNSVLGDFWGKWLKGKNNLWNDADLWGKYDEKWNEDEEKWLENKKNFGIDGDIEKNYWNYNNSKFNSDSYNEIIKEKYK